MEADILLQSSQQAYREKNKSTTMLLIENFGLILQFGVHWQQFCSTTWLLAPLTPDLAMGCQRLLDFQSTAKDFEGSQIEMGRSNVWWRFTHGWVRDRGKNKGGFVADLRQNRGTIQSSHTTLIRYSCTLCHYR